MSDSRANIWKYYLYRFICGISLTVPVVVLYLQENNLTVTQIMVLMSVYTGLIIVFGIFAGAFADFFGRKKTLLISTAMFTLGFLLYGISRSFSAFLLSEIVWAMADATFFGIGEAFVYDSLKNGQKQKLYKRVQGNAYAITDFMRGFSGIFGAIVGVIIGLRALFLISIIPGLIALLVVFTFKEPSHRKTLFESNYFKHLGETAKFVISKTQLRFIILFCAVLGSATFLTYFLFQVYFTENSLPLKYFGIAYALLFAFSAVGARSTHSLDRVFSNKASLQLILYSTVAVFLLLAFTKNTAAIFLAPIIWLFSGFRITLTSDIINKYAGSHHRATVLTINNAAFNFSFAVFSPLAGILVDKTSAHYAYLIIGLILAVFSVYVVGFLKKKKL